MNMTNMITKLKKILLHATTAAWMTVMTLASTPALADDTDIFLGPSSGLSSTERPNVLFILDTSGSMGSTEGTGVSGLTRLDAMKDAMTQILSSTNNINVGLMTFNTRGGPIRYPVSPIDAEVSAVEGAGFDIIQGISDANDDAEEVIGVSANSGNVALNSNHLHMSDKPDGSLVTQTFSITNGADDGHELIPGGSYVPGHHSHWVTPDREIALLFRNINIPPGAVITSARVGMTIDIDGNNVTHGGFNEITSDTNVTITAEASDSAAPFAATVGQIAGRVRTTQQHTWLGVPGLGQGERAVSTNLAGVIQEVVSRPGWVSGNNIALFLLATTGLRDMAPYEDGAGNAPNLEISYYPSPPSTEQQMIALRFQDVRIPQGAQVAEAYIDVNAATDSNAAMNYSIRGETSPDSAAFAGTNAELSGKPKTAAVANWALTTANTWLADQRYQSSNIATVIQEIVNQPTWCGGNSLTLFLEPNSPSTRRIIAYDGVLNSADEAPALRVDFDTNTANILPPNTGCTIADITVRVNDGDDDVEQRSSGNLATGGDLDIGNQPIGLRFKDVNLPQGSNIISAQLEFTAFEERSSGTSTRIYGHDVDNSTAFSGYQGVTNRINNASTTANQLWTIPAWNNIGQTHVSPDITPVIQEIVNRAGWAAGNDLSILMSKISGRREADSVNTNPAAAPRLMITAQMNLAGVAGVSGQTVRQKLIQEVQALELVSGTPIVDTFMEGVKYFRGERVDFWGDVRGAQYSNDRYGRVSSPFSYTAGSVNRHANCTDANLNASECRTERINGNPQYISPIKADCQPNIIVILSDGFQNTFYGQTEIQAMIGESCSASSGGSDCGLKLANWAKDTDHSPDLSGGFPGIQNIKTFTIGFTISTSFLRQMATFADDDSDYYIANNAAALVDAFRNLIASIQSESTTFVAPTLTLNAFNQLFNSNEIYISLFEPEVTKRWSGNLKKFNLCTPAQDEAGTCTVNQIMDANGQPATENGRIKDTARSIWSTDNDGPAVEDGGAGSKITNHSTRRVYTFFGLNKNLADPSNALSTSNAAALSTPLGLAGTALNDMINWIRGQDVDGPDPNATRWSFGDPLHSSAIPIAYGIDAGAFGGPAAIIKLFVGTNDGAMRLINSHTGEEEWAFIPPDMLSIQAGLRADLGGKHIYGMDGAPTAWINDDDDDGEIDYGPSSKDFVRVFIGQRRGGSNYYALDLSPNNNIANVANTNGVVPRLMWSIEGGVGDFARMGQSWSKPIHTRIQLKQGTDVISKNVIIFGGGYDTSNDSAYGPTTIGNAIYIVDAETGQRLWWASGPGSGADVVVSDMQYAIPSDVRIMDMDGNGSTDRLMVGDMGGQIWRVDLSHDFTGGSSSGVLIGKFAELSDNAPTAVPADQRTFMYRPSVALLNDAENSDTAKFVAVAIASGNRPNPLGKTTVDKAFVLRDFRVEPLTGTGGIADTTYPTIRMTDLYNATSDVSSTSNLVALKAASGWFINLVDSVGVTIGEKSIVEGRIIIPTNPSIPPLYTFNTFTPDVSISTTACQPNTGLNLIYAVNLLNSQGTDIFDTSSAPKRSVVNNTTGISPEIIIITQEGQGDGSIDTDGDGIPDSSGCGSTMMGGTGDGQCIDIGEGFVPIYWVD